MYRRLYLNTNDTEVPALGPNVVEVAAGRPWLMPFRKHAHELVTEAFRRMGLDEGKELGSYEKRRLWHTQASLYLMRFNEHTIRIVHKGLLRCTKGGGLCEDEMYNKMKRTMGMPLRGSDKCFWKTSTGSIGGEMACIKPVDVKDAAQRVFSGQPWLENVLITSEDKDLELSAVQLLSRQWKVYTNDMDLHPGTGSPQRQYTLANNVSLMPFEITQSALITIACQAMPAVHVLTMKSNFHGLIDMLSNVVPGKTAHFSYSMGTYYQPIR